MLCGGFLTLAGASAANRRLIRKDDIELQHLAIFILIHADGNRIGTDVHILSHNFKKVSLKVCKISRLLPFCASFMRDQNLQSLLGDRGRLWP